MIGTFLHSSGGADERRRATVFLRWHCFCTVRVDFRFARLVCCGPFAILGNFLFCLVVVAINSLLRVSGQCEKWKQQIYFILVSALSLTHIASL